MFTVCALLYGDHTQLAKRCLNSIATPESAGYVRELRIGMNCPSVQTKLWVNDQIGRIQELYPVKTYCTFENSLKYPMMRNMFRDLPEDTDIMWFDDDSYIDKEDFWPKCAAALTPDIDMLGQQWVLRFQGDQRKWIEDQPWFNPDVWKKDDKYMKFCQGAWWVARAALFKELNWPIPELRHCGGDSMLGEVLRHTGKKVKYYDYGVRINADENGQHSKAPRRGYTEKVIAYRYDGSPLSTSHQDFFYVQGCYPCLSKS